MNEIASGVAHLPIPVVEGMPFPFVNVYFAGAPGGPWALVDTGLPGHAKMIQAASEERYGLGAKPDAIILTHGHFDHVGSAGDLWKDVPVYAHHRELPFITGKHSYPPPDPRVGGFLAVVGYLPSFPPFNLEDRAKPLPDDNSVPGMPGWAWVHTPGHAPGHVSLFREEDGALLAGDAFATTNMYDFLEFATQYQEITAAGPPFNYDWEAVRESVRKLAALNPKTAGCGHGEPWTHSDVAEQLRALVENVDAPRGSWYKDHPGRVDEDGKLLSPPPPKVSLPPAVIGAVLGAVALGILMWRRRAG